MAEQSNLFNLKSRPVKPKAEDPYPGEGRRLVALYVDLYTAKYHEAPNFEEKHAAILKRLITRFGPTRVEERLRFFMRWNDAFVEEAGHTIAVFNATWDKQTAALRRLQGPAGGNGLSCCGTHNPPCQTATEHSQRVIDDMKTPRSALKIVHSRTTSKPSEPC